MFPVPVNMWSMWGCDTNSALVRAVDTQHHTLKPERYTFTHRGNYFLICILYAFYWFLNFWNLIPTKWCKIVKCMEHKYPIISKKDFNYAVCKMDGKSNQSISGPLALAAITHTWPRNLHPQKGCCFTDCLQILSSRKDISETRACQALYLFIKYALGLAYSQDDCNWEICSCRH